MRRPVEPQGAEHYDAVDVHVEGLPVRVVTGGAEAYPGDTMEQRRQWFAEHRDGLRTLLMCEPRGNAWMSGAILQPPTRSDADVGVLFIEVTGVLPMCGAGTIGVATVLVESGLVDVVEPVTAVTLDTPIGLIRAEVRVRAGRAESVTIAGVPSFALELDRALTVPGIGEVTCDIAFGGNFYAFVQSVDLGLDFARAGSGELIAAGQAVMEAVNAQALPVHPGTGYSGCEHTVILAPGSDARRTRHALINYPGWLDRSPGGTGTSARMAQLYARGELPLGAEFVNESFIGTSFTGVLQQCADPAGPAGAAAVDDVPVDAELVDAVLVDAVLPRFTGRAWRTAEARYILDPTDPFPAGFTV